MPFLPARADLEQLRRQAKDLLRKAERGDPAAATRIRSLVWSSYSLRVSARIASMSAWGGFESIPARSSSVPTGVPGR